MMIEVINNAIYKVSEKGVFPEFIFLQTADYKTFCREVENGKVWNEGFVFRGIIIRDLKQDIMTLVTTHPNLAEGFICERSVLNVPTQQVYKKGRVFTLKTLTEVTYEDNKPFKVFSDN